MMMRASLIEHIGNFRDDLELEDDIEFSLRATLAGYVNYRVPQAKIKHTQYFVGGILRDVSMFVRTDKKLKEIFGDKIKTKYNIVNSTKFTVRLCK